MSRLNILSKRKKLKPLTREETKNYLSEVPTLFCLENMNLDFRGKGKNPV